jgi:hypothetical protein
MSFGDLFPVDPPEPEPEPPVEHEQPEWLGPPSGELGVAVPFGLVLARSHRGVVALSHALVHSTGVQFQVVAHVDGLRAGESNLLFHEQHVGRMGLSELPGGFLRFGIELPDGARVSNLTEGGWRRSPQEREATGPVLRQSGGSGGGSSTGTSVDWSVGYWFWPLPHAGVLRLFCEWPVAEIGLASAEIDAAPLIEAAGGATRLWPPEGAGSCTRSVGSQQSVSTMSFSGTGMVAESEADESSIAVSPAQLAALRRALEDALALIDGLRKPAS